jgi:ribonuclease P/MRP protein subunit POP1
MTGISLFFVLQLHHMDRSPYAAIAPVTLLWRPVPKELQPEQSIGLIPAEKRQVWVWVHAAAFDEALMCLQTACQRQVRHVVDLVYAV